MTLATKYIWWKAPAEAVELPQRIAAQVMDVGDYDEVQTIVHTAGATIDHEFS